MTYRITSEFSEIILSCRLAFSRRSWPYLMAMMLPWLLQSGQRHIRKLRRWAGWKRHESSYYRFLSRHKFRPPVFFRALLQLVIKTFDLKKLLLVVDDTLCPKWGKKIFGTGTHYDHTRRPQSGYLWGHNWVVIAVVVQLFGVWIAIPIWVALYRNKKGCPPEEFRTRIQLAAEVMQTLRGWTTLPIEMLADGAYNNRSFHQPLQKLGIPLISRLRWDARLRRDPPRRRKKRRGKPARYGKKLPPLRRLGRKGRGWQRIGVQIYGKCVLLRIKSFDAWWPKSGVKLRVVIARDQAGKRSPCFLSSSDLNKTPKEIIERFACRWSIEQLFSDAKNLMGLDSAEVRSRNSVLRHAFFTFAMVAWTRVWAKKHLRESSGPPTSFAGQLGRLRENLMTHTIIASLPEHLLSKRNSEDLARLAIAA